MMYKGYIHNTTRMQDLMSRIIWLLFFFFISLIAYYSYIPGKYTFKSKVRMQCSTQFTPKQTFKTNILILSAYTMFPCWFCAIQCSSYCFLLLFLLDLSLKDTRITGVYFVNVCRFTSGLFMLMTPIQYICYQCCSGGSLSSESFYIVLSQCLIIRYIIKVYFSNSSNRYIIRGYNKYLFNIEYMRIYLTYSSFSCRILYLLQI